MKFLIVDALIISPVAVDAQNLDQPAKNAEKPEKEKKICRSMNTTGFFMATGVCNTAAAWRQFDEITADGAWRDIAQFAQARDGRAPQPFS